MLSPTARAVLGAPAAPVRHLSPLRYPGAKTKLTPHLAAMIASARRARRLRGPLTLVEPFAGGAGVTLKLVTDRVVDRALIGDADPMLAAFWRVAAQRPDELIGRMVDEHIEFLAAGGDEAVARWDYWRAFSPSTDSLEAERELDLATKCLFLNRTTFSGILHGSAGPIGGRAQKSAYRIDCRFPLDGLANRIRWIGHLHETERLLTPRESDWRSTLDAAINEADDPRTLVAYLDPPYIEKSERLYATGFDGSGHAPDVWGDITPHQHLAEYLRTEAPFRWILSYDHHPELLTNVFLYGRARTTPTRAARARGAAAWRMTREYVTIQHSASTQTSRRSVTELLLSTL